MNSVGSDSFIETLQNLVVYEGKELTEEILDNGFPFMNLENTGEADDVVADEFMYLHVDTFPKVSLAIAKFADSKWRITECVVGIAEDRKNALQSEPLAAYVLQRMGVEDAVVDIEWDKSIDKALIDGASEFVPNYGDQTIGTYIQLCDCMRFVDAMSSMMSGYSIARAVWQVNKRISFDVKEQKIYVLHEDKEELWQPSQDDILAWDWFIY